MSKLYGIELEILGGGDALLGHKWKYEISTLYESIYTHKLENGIEQQEIEELYIDENKAKDIIDFVMNKHLQQKIRETLSTSQTNMIIDGPYYTVKYIFDTHFESITFQHVDLIDFDSFIDMVNETVQK